jgi:CheY-like chemotaxis protein
MEMGTSLSVLYVEDDPQSREVMELLLRSELGLSNITIFEDSTDFMARVERLRLKPDIILLDIHMHPYTGFEMLEMLREQGAWSSVPVIALTASVMNEEVQQLKLAGFNGVIAKPIDLDTFPDALQRVLNGQQVWRIK